MYRISLGISASKAAATIKLEYFSSWRMNIGFKRDVCVSYLFVSQKGISKYIWVSSAKRGTHLRGRSKTNAFHLSGQISPQACSCSFVYSLIPHMFIYCILALGCQGSEKGKWDLGLYSPAPLMALLIKGRHHWRSRIGLGEWQDMKKYYIEDKRNRWLNWWAA
jgi:hypothetical protein